MAPVREVAFELECFEWADERLEVAGRWKGLGARRLNRPVLTVHTESGRRKRIVAMPGGQPAAGGEAWRASFAWPGDPGEITDAALEVGGSLVVDLPLPDRRRRRRRRSATEHADETLRAEVGALRGQVERLRAELAGREREIIALRSRLDEETDEEGPELSGADERTVEIERLAGERDAAHAELVRIRDERLAGADAMTVEIERLSAERDAALAAAAAAAARRDEERDAEQVAADLLAEERAVERAAEHEAERARWQADLDVLREAFSDAAAEAETVRERHREAIAGLEEQLRAERAEVARLIAELADMPAPPGDATREHAAAPPTLPLPRPPVMDDAEPPGADEAAASADDDAPPADDLAPADEAPPPADELAPAADEGPPPAGERGAPAGDAFTPPAVADAPGPLRAGSRPVSPPLVEDEARGERVPAWLSRGAAVEEDTEHTGALHAIKERIGHLFTSNGHEPHEDGETGEDVGVPRPRRSAAAARARAEATVAARRSSAEVWGMRILAAVFVAALLTAFLLLLLYIA